MSRKPILHPVCSNLRFETKIDVNKYSKLTAGFSSLENKTVICRKNQSNH
jgi:hypothetical protein